MSSDKKAKKRERERELRDSTGCGFKKDLVADRHLDDQRYERSRAAAAAGQSVAAAAPAAIPGLTPGGPPASATMDTILRMQAGLGLRTIADNINDPNRPTWEEVGCVVWCVRMGVVARFAGLVGWGDHSSLSNVGSYTLHTKGFMFVY